MNPFHVDQDVWVHAMGSYYPGVVVKVGEFSVYATYTSGTNTTRTKRVRWDAYAAAHVPMIADRPAGSARPNGTRQKKGKA
jgi:hypothetical protein